MKYLDRITIALLLALVCVGLTVAHKTTESNLTTVDVAKIQAENRGKLLKEIKLLSLELRMLKSDVEEIRDRLKKSKKSSP